MWPASEFLRPAEAPGARSEPATARARDTCMRRAVKDRVTFPPWLSVFALTGYSALDDDVLRGELGYVRVVDEEPALS